MVKSTTAKELGVMLFFALAWNAMTGALVWNFRAELAVDSVKLLWVGVFVLAGLWLLYLALKSYLQWRRFGSLHLSVDPHPVAVGGDLGGVIEIPGLRATYNAPFEVTVSCIHVTVRRSGKRRSRHERVQWRERGTVAGEPGVRGTRLRFRFAVPDNLPATTPPSNSYYKWVVHVHGELPGVDLDQTFEVPVEKSDAPQQSRSGIDYTAEQGTAVSAIAASKPQEASVQIGYGAQGLRLFYPSARNRGMGVAVLIFGLVFGGVPVFLSTQLLATPMSGAFAVFTLGATGFMALIFGLFAVLLVVAGLYLLGNSLEVVISPRGLETVRRVYGMPMRRRYFARELITGLQSKISGQTGQGAKAKVRYTIKAEMSDGRAVTIGDGIRGVTEAKRVLAQVRKHLGVQEEPAI